ncbi:MAG: nuclear transport factor 2 family protein [Ilumatobacter sp.]|uniref:nuclear transport factor 2 family protein n=1 Tax=Ilumatobacter sp. TaxID=1967498 RepID=UPI003C75FE1F
MTASTPAEAAAVAAAYLTALGGDDPAAVAALVSEDFRNEHHAALGSGCVGREEYARRLPGFFATFANRHYEVIETTVGATLDDTSRTDDVVVNYRFQADVDTSGDTVTRIDIPGVMWISVHDGAVVRRLDCWDSLVFHRQTGTTPDA